MMVIYIKYQKTALAGMMDELLNFGPFPTLKISCRCGAASALVDSVRYTCNCHNPHAYLPLEVCCS
jgi:hypothetical protein